jgi:hypothetical protein
MSDASDALPDDVATLKRLLLGRDEMIAKLLAEIARLKRWRFGRSAERLDPALMQLQLTLDELLLTPARELSDPAARAVEDSTGIAPVNRAPRRLARAPRLLPAHLPREIIVHAPPSCTCPDCGALMRKLGEDISELLDFIPGYFKVCQRRSSFPQNGRSKIPQYREAGISRRIDQSCSFRRARRRLAACSLGSAEVRRERICSGSSCACSRSR